MRKLLAITAVPSRRVDVHMPFARGMAAEISVLGRHVRSAGKRAIHANIVPDEKAQAIVLPLRFRHRLRTRAKRSNSSVWTPHGTQEGRREIGRSNRSGTGFKSQWERQTDLNCKTQVAVPKMFQICLNFCKGQQRRSMHTQLDVLCMFLVAEKTPTVCKKSLH